MSAERWARIRDLLAIEGVTARLDERSYTESVYGRTRHGVSRSIFIRTDNGSVEIRDCWWSKNPDKWLGYEVALVNREGFELRRHERTKNRRIVVLDALDLLGREAVHP